MRILAVVVRYFATTNNIGNFRGEVGDVLMIDNSYNNIGVAAALNIGLKKAIEENYDWLLTMDQDSFFTEGSLKKLKEAAFASDVKTAWVSPYRKTQKRSKPKTNVKFTMTSGSLLRVSACKQAGFFEEKLFIDSVDNEYCLRLGKMGFKIVQVNHAILEHTLGELQHGFITHDASRRYYITRNMLYVMKKYPSKFFLFGFKELIKSFMLIIFSEDYKHAKIKSFFVGIKDFVIGRYGPR